MHESWPQIFHGPKNPILIYDVHIDRIVVSNKVPFGKKKVLNILLGTKIIKKRGAFTKGIMLPERSGCRKIPMKQRIYIFFI